MEMLGSNPCYDGITLEPKAVKSANETKTF